MAIIGNIQRISAFISVIIPNAVINMRIMLRNSPISFSMRRQLLRRNVRYNRNISLFIYLANQPCGGFLGCCGKNIVQEFFYFFHNVDS